tara:strand:+ start:2066 stop:2416 length:351 start_codon:yes stop_codon:yes gene_type:complete
VGKTGKLISKVIVAMGVVAAGSYLILNDSNSAEVDSFDKSIFELDSVSTDSVSICDTIPVIAEDTIEPKTTVVKEIPVKDTTIVKSVENRTFKIILSVKDTVLSDTSSLMKSFYKK